MKDLYAKEAKARQVAAGGDHGNQYTGGKSGGSGNVAGSGKNQAAGDSRDKAANKLGIKCPVKVVKFASQDEAENKAFELNIKRRRCSVGQRQDMAKKLRQRGWSYERIGGVIGVNKSTACRWLGETLEDSNETTLQMQHGFISNSENANETVMDSHTGFIQPDLPTNAATKIHPSILPDIAAKRDAGETLAQIAAYIPSGPTEQAVGKAIRKFKRDQQHREDIIESTKAASKSGTAIIYNESASEFLTRFEDKNALRSPRLLRRGWVSGVDGQKRARKLWNIFHN